MLRRFERTVLTQIRNSNFQYFKVILNTKKMLTILHICSFLMLYDSGNMSLEDNETDVLRNQSRKMYHAFFGKFNF